MPTILSEKLSAMRAKREQFDGAIHIRGSRRKFFMPATGMQQSDCFGHSASDNTPSSTKCDHKRIELAVRRNSMDSSNSKIVQGGVQGVATILEQKRNLEAEFFVTDVPEIEDSFERLGLSWKSMRTPSASSGCSAFSRLPSASSTSSAAEHLCSEEKA
eukprot:3878495-Rhodomonas_salina.2